MKRLALFAAAGLISMLPSIASARPFFFWGFHFGPPVPVVVAPILPPPAVLSLRRLVVVSPRPLLLSLLRLSSVPRPNRSTIITLMTMDIGIPISIARGDMRTTTTGAKPSQSLSHLNLKPRMPTRGFFSFVKPHPLAHDIQRPLFYLFINPPDIFPENPHRNKLHAAEKQNADDFGRETGDLFSPGEKRHDIKNRQRRTRGRMR